MALNSMSALLAGFNKTSTPAPPNTMYVMQGSFGVLSEATKNQFGFLRAETQGITTCVGLALVDIAGKRSVLFHVDIFTVDDLWSQRILDLIGNTEFDKAFVTYTQRNIDPEYVGQMVVKVMRFAAANTKPGSIEQVPVPAGSARLGVDFDRVYVPENRYVLDYLDGKDLFHYSRFHADMGKFLNMEEVYLERARREAEKLGKKGHRKRG